jgi:branched-chain amino acid transport system ATP-binding protein
VLEIRDIHTYYGESHILQGLSLVVQQGSLIALLGRNGVGKTTLVCSVVGFVPPRSGHILFRGLEIAGEPSYRIVRMGIGVVPQGRRIFPSLTVQENLLIAARKGTREGREFDLDAVYGLFPKLRERARHGGNELSGGEQQMLAIGRALIGNPTLMLLDEPSEGLAPLLVQKIADTIVALKSRGLSMLLVEQNLNMAMDLADYVYIMSKGRVVYASQPADLVTNDEVKLVYLGVGK